MTSSARQCQHARDDHQGLKSGLVVRVGVLQRRLLALALVALLPMAAVSAWVVDQLVNTQRAEIQQASTATARALMTAVDKELDLSIAALETLAGSTRLAAGDLAGFHREALDIAAKRPFWLSVQLLEPTGAQLLTTRRPLGTPLPPTNDPESLAAVVRTGRPAVGNPVLGAVRPEPLFAVRVPVRLDGTLRYVVSAVVLPASLQEVIARQKVPATGIVAVLDARGHVVARSREHDRWSGKPAPRSLAELVQGGVEGWGSATSLDGEPMYAAYSRSPKTGWSVALGTPRAAVDAPLRSSALALGAALAVSLVLGLAAAVFAARSIVRPMRALQEAARAVGRGERPAAPRTAISEIREAGHALIEAQGARASAEEALRETDRRKDEFISLLAHELRNPLAPVRNSVAILKRCTPGGDPRQQRAVEIAERQVAHMARLLDDLLDVSRIATGKIALRLEQCDVAAETRQVAEDYRPILEAAGLSLLVHAHPEPLWVDADPVRLAQVVGNLLTNAERFNEEGGRIAVGVKADPDRRTAVIEVSNTGVGIDAAMMPRLFSPFQQAAQNLARSKGGLGLGLAVTKGLVELHGGTVTAHSDGPGRGAVFTVRLPLRAHDPGAGVSRSTEDARLE